MTVILPEYFLCQSQYWIIEIYWILNMEYRLNEIYKWLCFLSIGANSSINLGLTGSNNTCPLYADFLLSLTIIAPLLSAGLGTEL